MYDEGSSTGLASNTIPKNMGADLYRQYRKGAPKTDYEPMGFERSTEAVDAGYFRDAYNDGSILGRYGLSWWADIIPLQNRQGVLSVAKLKKFRAMLNDAAFDQNIVGLPKDERAYFNEGRVHLKRFMDDAIAAGDGIDASL